MRDYIFFAANHLAIAAFESPNAAAGSYIDVMNSFLAEFICSPDVIYVIRIATVDKNVVLLY